MLLVALKVLESALKVLQKAIKFSTSAAKCSKGAVSGSKSAVNASKKVSIPRQSAPWLDSGIDTSTNRTPATVGTRHETRCLEKEVKKENRTPGRPLGASAPRQ